MGRLFFRAHSLCHEAYIESVLCFPPLIAVELILPMLHILLLHAFELLNFALRVLPFQQVHLVNIMLFTFFLQATLQMGSAVINIRDIVGLLRG